MVFRLLNNSYTLNYKCKSFIKLTPDSTSKMYSTGYSGGRGGKVVRMSARDWSKSGI